MSPILGIYASSMQPALNATSFESIATVTVGAGGSSNVTFSSIPSTYKHLQIRISTLCSTNGPEIYSQFNSDTAGNYSWHSLFGNGATASGSNLGTSATAIYTAGLGVGQSTSYPFVIVYDILDYADTNKYKTARILAGSDKNGSGEVELISGNWRSTSAINAIKLYGGSGNFAQYSSFALYGIKGA